MPKEIIYQLLPYPEQCLKVRGHEKLRRNGLVPHSMKWIDNKCKNFTQHQCPNCKMYVVWIKKINMSVSSKIKQKIFLRDNYKCFYCGNDLKHDFRMTYPTPTSKITVDHVIPKHTGGTGKQSNLVTCCKNCNSKKELIERPIKLNK